MRRLWGSLLCLLWLGAAAVAQELLTAAQFTGEVVQALKAASPNTPVTTTGELSLRVTRPDGSVGIFDLGDAYKLYRQQPGRRTEVVRNFITLATRSNGPSHADRTRIIPTVKTRAWLADVQARYKAQAPGQGPVFEELNKELVVVYAEDTEKGARFLSTNEKLGIPREELRRTALANLRRILPKIELKVDRDTGVFMISANGDYDTSLMLFDEIWTGGQVKVKGDFVVAVPVRNMLLVTGSRDRKGLKAMRALAAQAFAEGPASQTETLFVYRKGQFAPFGRSKKSEAAAE